MNNNGLIFGCSLGLGSDIWGDDIWGDTYTSMSLAYQWKIKNSNSFITAGVTNIYNSSDWGLAPVISYDIRF